MMKKLLLCCLMGTIIGCSNDVDGRIIPMDSMQVIMWDMMKADEVFIRKLVADTNATKNKEDVKLYETVFRIHKISKDRFFESYRYYEAHPILMKEIIDSIDSKSNRERIERYSGKRNKL
ncbi:MAG: DUF4296 domain-containing protein [Sediminibacterium sp.]|jgi:hypothetical protein|uniref:DUF4296 domain-containing protein n=1 Tax=Sediminibacterium sp. TaxID=1917865 RepID=UPI002AB8F422|nr:DUF4296 domain-containing protein [Sediminibacterium sp.]